MSPARPRVRSHCAAAAAMLAIGVLCTVGVAWAFPWFSRFPSSAIGQDRGGVAFRNGAVDVRAWRARGVYRLETVFNPFAQRPAGDDDYPPSPLTPAGKFDEALVMRLCDDYAGEPPGSGYGSPPTRSRAVERSGWPWLAMESEIRGQHRLARDGERTIEFGYVIPRRQSLTPAPGTRSIYTGAVALDRLETVPLRPVWKGFIANTALYAGCAWLLFFLPRIIRAYFRDRRGACARCGYDRQGLADDALCPECGRRDAALADARARQRDSIPRLILSSITLALLIGAAITIFSAWACAGFARFSAPGLDGAAYVTVHRRALEEMWRSANVEAQLIQPGSNVPNPYSHVERATGVRRALGYGVENGLIRGRLRESAGWPMPALQLTAVVENANAEHIHWGMFAASLKPSAGTVIPGRTPIDDRLVALPLRPMWPGFAVNTFAFAGLAWLLAFARPTIRRVRHIRRRHRGCCERCNYGRRGLAPDAPCPECAQQPCPIRV